MHGLNSVVHDFGDLVSTVYTQDSVTSDIALSDSVLVDLALNKLNTNKISSSEIQLTCGTLQLYLNFVYPVKYNGIKIKLSRARRLVVIICPRQIHHFEEEKPIFVAYPDHQLSLPPQDVKTEILSAHSAVQMMSSNAVHTIEFCSIEDPLSNVSLITKMLISYHFIRYHNEMKIRGMVVVNKRLFDYQHKLPAMDLAFYFPDSYPENFQWKEKKLGAIVSLNDAEYNELRKVLLYFSKRTNGDCKSAGVSSIYCDLVQQGIDEYFIRAVVYFLYSDPELLSSALKCQSKCSFCSKFGIMKKCKRCGDAKYCDRECQVKH